MFNRTAELLRLMILVAGIVLLVVFSTRAASQASNIKLVGGKHKLFIASVTADSLAHLQPTGSFAAAAPFLARSHPSAGTWHSPHTTTVASRQQPAMAPPAASSMITVDSKLAPSPPFRPTLPAHASPVAQARIQETPVAQSTNGLPIRR